MKKLIRRINADKIIRLATYNSLLIILFQLILIVIFYNSLPPVLPLFNQMPWGIERIGTKIEIFLPLLLTTIFTIMNLILGLRIHNKMPLVSRILSITGLLACILSFIFVLRTIQLII